MSGDTYDVQGEVRDALSTAVNSYGKRVLSDPRVLGNLVADLLPDNPRERSLLVAAAEAGIAGELTQNVDGQHMDAETAVALAAQSLTDNRSLDRAASLWVATEYAKALGYPVQSQSLPPVDSAPPAPQAPGHDPTMLANQPVSPWTPAPAASPWGQSPASTPDPAPNPWGPTSAPSPAPNPWGPTSAPSPAPNPWGPTSAPNPAADQDANGWAPTSTSNPAVNANGWAPTSTSNPPVNANGWAQSPAPNPSPSPWGQSPASNPSSNPASNPPPAPDPWASPSPAPSNPWSPTPPPPPGGQGPWPAASPAPKSSRRGLFLGGGTAVAILVAYVAIAAVAQVFPFAKSSSNPTPLPTLTSPAPIPTTSGSGIASPTPTGTGTGTGTATGTAGLAPLAAGVKPLKVLMPYDISDANTECTEQEKIPWTNPGLVKALECTAPDMPDGQIFGYQLDNTADYQKAWANYNSWAEFGTSKTLDCPPTGSNTQGGPTKWWGPRFPKREGQVIECFTSDSGPVYIWSYPTEDTFMVAQPAKSWAFSKLETWWENNAV